MYYTMSQVAEQLGTNENRREYDKVRWLCRSQQLKPMTIGHIRLFTNDDIEQAKQLLQKREEQR